MKAALAVLAVLAVTCSMHVTVRLSGVPVAVPVPVAAACVIVPAAVAAAALVVRAAARDGLRIAVAWNPGGSP